MPLDVDLDRLQALDAAYFTELYRTFTPRLRARTLTLGACADDADDIVQEAWTRAFERRARYLGRGSFEGWLWRTCRRLWLDRVRTEHRQHIALAATDMSRLDSFARSDDDAIRRGCAGQEITDWIDDEIMRLSKQQRQVAALRWLLGHSTEQTAAELGVACGTVKAALFQARRKMRSHLSELSVRRNAD